MPEEKNVVLEPNIYCYTKYIMKYSITNLKSGVTQYISTCDNPGVHQILIKLREIERTPQPHSGLNIDAPPAGGS